MSLYRPSRSLPQRFRLVLASFLQRPGLPFADPGAPGPEEAVQKAFDDEDASFAADEDLVYTPTITLWAFLSQVLFKDEQRSCVAAVVPARRDCWWPWNAALAPTTRGHSSDPVAVGARVGA